MKSTNQKQQKQIRYTISTKLLHVGCFNQWTEMEKYEMEVIVASHMTCKELIPKVGMRLLQLNSKTTTKQNR
jgi:hypothetical protein